jgi:hypothetical protein
LPLYCLLAGELIGDDHPAEVGYIAICRNPEKIGFSSVGRWARRKGERITFEKAMQSALEAIHDVVRRIRKGEFFTADGFEPSEPIFAAIGGIGLVATGESRGEAEE